jgi:threonine dehydrogenase-like Zn-dependent dehydrogenase
MKTLVFKKKNELEWQDTPAPLITGPGQAIVQPIAVARCDLDLPILRGQTLFRPPFPLGHEFVGRILQVSEDLAGEFRPGEDVAVAFQISCGSCPACSAHHTKSCTTVPFASNYGLGPSGRQFGGALTEAVLVPYARSMLLPLPSNADPIALASLSDNIVEAWKLAGRYLENRKNARVLVTGGLAASIGIYTAMLARAMGAHVTYADTDRARLEMAEKAGVSVLEVGEWPKSLGEFDIVCEAAGTQEGWNSSLRSVAPEGVLSSASIFFRNDVPIPYLELYNKGVRLDIGRVDSRESMPRILEWVHRNGFDPGRVVTQTASFADAKDAWMQESTKLVIDMR